MNNGIEDIKDMDIQEENDIFQSIINLLNQNLDIKHIQIGFCELVYKYCKSEATGLLILDPEDKRLIQRKIYRGGDDWFLEDSFQVQDESLFNKLSNKTSFYLDLLKPGNEFDNLYVLYDQPYQSALLLPLKEKWRIRRINSSIQCQNRSNPKKNRGIKHNSRVLCAQYEELRFGTSPKNR